MIDHKLIFIMFEVFFFLQIYYKTKYYGVGSQSKPFADKIKLDTNCVCF